MSFEDDLASARQNNDPEGEVLAFLRGRSVPCPRCAYDLRDAPTAKCPECGEPLLLKIGSPKLRFGWLVLAIAPGCFSGVAALFVLIPIVGSTFNGFPGQGPPWPIFLADIFGFTSAASVGLMYVYRHRILSWSTKIQRTFAIAVWAVHILAFLLLVLSLWIIGP